MCLLLAAFVGHNELTEDVSLLMILVPVTAIGTLVLYLIRSIWDEPINAWARYFLIPLVLLFLAVVLLQSLSLTTKACRAVGRYEWHEIQSTVCCLWTNAVLIVLGPALSFYTLVVQTTDFFYISQSYWLTLDFSLQIFNSLLLSGMLALYGTVPPIAYLSVVDPSCEGDELAFKQADAAAMGQHLLVKKSHTSTVESDHELANALQEAQRRERNERNCPGL
eukprot:g32776.t1